MAEDPRLILHFKTFNKFKERLADGTINRNRHFCIIQDTNQFWVRDHFIDGKVSDISKVYNDWSIDQTDASTITITLKGQEWNDTARTWSNVSYPITINAATESIAGLMTAKDAKDVRTNLPKSISDEVTRAKEQETEIKNKLIQLITSGGQTTIDSALQVLKNIGKNQEYSTVQKIAEKLRTFLEDRDLADTTINKWKEIEDFLAGITDKQTLLGIIKEAVDKEASLRSDADTTLQNNKAATGTIWGKTLNATSNNITGNLTNVGNIIPTIESVYTLGTPELPFNKCYLSGNYSSVRISNSGTYDHIGTTGGAELGSSSGASGYLILSGENNDACFIKLRRTDDDQDLVWSDAHTVLTLDNKLSNGTTSKTFRILGADVGISKRLAVGGFIDTTSQLSVIGDVVATAYKTRNGKNYEFLLADGNIAYGMKVFQQSTIDANEMLTPGVYRCGSNNPNIPSSNGYGNVLVVKSIEGADTVSQLYFDHYQNKVYIRSGLIGDQWKDSNYYLNKRDWKELASVDSTVSQINVGTTPYNVSSGVISLPSYPTQLPASDVYSWAKQPTKPSYDWSEINNRPTIPTNTNQLTNGAGFTTNKGTVTSVTINGSNKTPDINGVVDLGTITSGSGGSSVTESTVSGWGFTKNVGTVTQVKVGDVAYNPNNGVISLPAYPTSVSYATSAGSASSATTAGSCSGNAATATTADKVAHKITFTGAASGSFDGSSDITINIPSGSGTSTVTVVNNDDTLNWGYKTTIGSINGSNLTITVPTLKAKDVNLDDLNFDYSQTYLTTPDWNSVFKVNTTSKLSSWVKGASQCINHIYNKVIQPNDYDPITFWFSTSDYNSFTFENVKNLPENIDTELQSIAESICSGETSLTVIIRDGVNYNRLIIRNIYLSGSRLRLVSDALTTPYSPGSKNFTLDIYNKTLS